MAKRGVGRPEAIDKDTLRELEGYFADGASDEMACFLANIAPSTLYLYQTKHPELIERKAWLKEQVRYQARKNIRDKIRGGDTETSKWLLERRDKEYKPKSDLTTDDKPIPLLAYVQNNHLIDQITQPEEKD